MGGKCVVAVVLVMRGGGWGWDRVVWCGDDGIGCDKAGVAS